MIHVIENIQKIQGVEKKVSSVAQAFLVSGKIYSNLYRFETL